MAQSWRGDRASGLRARPPVPYGIFTYDDFIRAWQGTPPSSARSSPRATILVRRRSPRDVRGRPFRVSIDEQPLAELSGGEAVAQLVSPGAHVVRISNWLRSQTLIVTVRAGEQVRLICGAGAVRPKWLAGLVPCLADVGIWLGRD